MTFRFVLKRVYNYRQCSTSEQPKRRIHVAVRCCRSVTDESYFGRENEHLYGPMLSHNYTTTKEITNYFSKLLSSIETHHSQNTERERGISNGKGLTSAAVEVNFDSL